MVISEPARSRTWRGSIEGPAEKLYTRALLMVDKPPICNLGRFYLGRPPHTQCRGKNRFTVLKGIIYLWENKCQ